MPQFTKSEIEHMINKAVNAGILSGEKNSTNYHKQTERRLYAYSILADKIKSDKEYLKELKAHGAPEKSKSILKYSQSGQRLSREEIRDALILDVTAGIARDEHESEIISNALKTISSDGYYDVIQLKYMDKKTDDEIAEYIGCDPSTVRRNKNRLIKNISVWLYGASAI